MIRGHGKEFASMAELRRYEQKHKPNRVPTDILKLYADRGRVPTIDEAESMAKELLRRRNEILNKL